MKEPVEIFHRMKDLPSEHLLAGGTPMCAGCGGLQAIHEIVDVLGENTVFVNAAGCMTLLATYPFTPFRGSWFYTAMASAPAGAQGVRDALDIQLAKSRINEDENLQVVVLTGDGSANGMGLSATSGTIERNLDYLYICYDNEGYGNTGHQHSGATPHGAISATDKSDMGFSGFKKDLFNIWASHEPAYLATVIGSEPLDLAKKIEKAKSIRGPKLIIAFSPCPTGWNYDPEETVKVGQLAVKSGIWPLKEYINGEVIHTIKHKKRLAVEEYLSTQGRFEHLFYPQRNERVIQEIQENVDTYWEKWGQ